MTQMRDVDHTHPHTDEPFGEPFERGPAVAPDGGEKPDGFRTSSEECSDGSDRSDGPRTHRDGADEEAEEAEEAEEETMEDVDHEASTEDTTRAFERGTEGRDDSV